MIEITLDLPDDIMEALEKTAKEHNLTIEEIVNICLSTKISENSEEFLPQFIERAKKAGFTLSELLIFQLLFRSPNNILPIDGYKLLKDAWGDEQD